MTPTVYPSTVEVPQPTPCQVAASSLYSVFNEAESMQTTTRFYTYLIKLLEQVGATLTEGVRYVFKAVLASDVIINGVNFLLQTRTFSKIMQEADVPDKLTQRDGRVQVIDYADKRAAKVGKTVFQYHLTHKPHLALADLSYLWAAFTGFVDLLGKLGLDVLSAASSTLGYLPLFGQALGTFVSQAFQATGLIAVVVGSCAHVLDSIQYIHFALSGDQTKDLTKGVLQLISRIAFGALHVCMMLKGQMITAIMGIASGVFGVVSIVYQAHKSTQDQLIQNALAQRLTESRASNTNH